MAIAVRGTSGTPLFGVNSVTPTIPTAQVTGDMMLLIAVGKPFDAGWSVATAGWTALGSAASGSTAAGIDSGSMKAQVWYKEATSDTETNPTLTEDTPTWNVIGCHIIVLSKGASESWATPVVVYGADETSGTAVSVTFASDPGVTAGDYVVCFFGSNSDALGPTTTNIVCTQTGVTFGTVTEHGDAETTSGGDMMYNDVSIPVSGGTGSAAPAMTATGTASGGSDKLEAGFIRLRVSTATPLTIQDAAHAHAADSLVLTQHNILAIQEALHGHAADNTALTQHNILAIADALHAHGADNVVLTLGGSVLLVVQDGAHVHTADNVILSIPSEDGGPNLLVVLRKLGSKIV